MRLLKLALISLILSSLHSAYAGYMDENTLWGIKHRTHQIEGEPRAVLLLTHGLIHHSGNFKHLLNKMKEEQVLVVSYDLRGHGSSHGKRGHINNFQSYISDLGRMVDMVKEKYPKLPLVLYGHSMGGLITFHYLTTEHSINKVTATILSSPALKFPLGIMDQIKMSSASVIREFMPDFFVEVELDTTKLTDVPFEADELRLKGMTVSLGDELSKAASLVYEEGVRPNTNAPIYLIQGRKDTVVDAFYIIKTAPEITNQQNILVLDEARHEPFNSSKPIREAYLNGISEFLKRAL